MSQPQFWYESENLRVHVWINRQLGVELRCSLVSVSAVFHNQTTKQKTTRKNRVFSHDVTAAIVLSQNKKTAAMFVFQINPSGVELFSYANAFFCSDKSAQMLTTWVKTLYNKTPGFNPASVFCWHPPILAERWVIGLEKSASLIRLPSSKCGHQY